MGISGNQRELSYYTIKPALISDLHVCGWSMGWDEDEGLTPKPQHWGQPQLETGQHMRTRVGVQGEPDQALWGGDAVPCAPLGAHPLVGHLGSPCVAWPCNWPAYVCNNVHATLSHGVCGRAGYGDLLRVCILRGACNMVVYTCSPGQPRLALWA